MAKLLNYPELDSLSDEQNIFWARISDLWVSNKLSYAIQVLEVITKLLLYLQLLEIFPLFNTNRCFFFFQIKDQDK